MPKAATALVLRLANFSSVKLASCAVVSPAACAPLKAPSAVEESAARSCVSKNPIWAALSAPNVVVLIDSACVVVNDLICEALSTAMALELSAFNAPVLRPDTCVVEKPLTIVAVRVAREVVERPLILEVSRLRHCVALK